MYHRENKLGNKKSKDSRYRIIVISSQRDTEPIQWNGVIECKKKSIFTLLLWI